MANSKSAEKRIRQNERRRVANQKVRSRVRTAKRRFEEAIAEGDLAAAETAFQAAQSELTRAGRKNVIPQERASRKVGRMSKQLDNLR